MKKDADLDVIKDEEICHFFTRFIRVLPHKWEFDDVFLDMY